MDERKPLSEDHRLLGGLLRTARGDAGATMRQVNGYSSGHISNVEHGKVTPSRELIELYITQFGCDRRHALHVYDKVKRWGAEKRRLSRVQTTEPPAAEAQYQVTEDSPFEEIRRGYELQESENYYRLDERGVIREASVIRWITARHPGVDLVGVRFWYTSELRPRLTIEAGNGCSVAKVLETSAGYLVAILRLSSPISPDDESALPFSFRVLNSSDIRAYPLIRYYTRSILSRFSLRVQFHDSAPPLRVWRFRDTHSSISAIAPGPDQFFERNPSGFYFTDFHNINEEHAGISWEWPEEIAWAQV